MHETHDDDRKDIPKEFEKKTTSLASKLQGKVRVKKKSEIIAIEKDRIELKKGEYVKLIGITTVDRTPLYSSNLHFIYLLELTNNLDFIATSILGGELDKMTLISENTQELEKAQFYTKNNLIYIVYGSFPDKKGKWILEQMHKHFQELVLDKDPNNLTKLEKHQIKAKFTSIMKFILEEYLNLQDVFSDQEIPYVEDKLTLHYLGLSSRSIGVISLILGNELKIELPGKLDSPEEIAEMKESLLTAKIEAIAANTLGNTGAIPRWIAVKLGFQHYRFLTFKKFKNEYYTSLLTEGNLEKLESLEEHLEPLISQVIENPFHGDLKPFNKLKRELTDKLSKSRAFY